MQRALFGTVLYGFDSFPLNKCQVFCYTISISDQCYPDSNIVWSRDLSSALLFHDSKETSETSIEDCEKACEVESEFVCSSFDYDSGMGSCFMSTYSSADAGSYIANQTVHSNWTYAEWNCDNGNELFCVSL